MKHILEKKYTPVEMEGICRLAVESPAELVQKSEEYYNTQVMTAAKNIAGKKEIKFVLLCGPSASGKTTTAHKLKHRIIAQGRGARVVSMDNFFKGIESYPKLPNGKPDMESVEALDLPLMNKCFEQLMETGEADLPTFDFAAQQRTFNAHHVTLGEGDVLIMEGIHALNPGVLNRIPRENVYRIYVSVRSKFINGDETILIPKDIRLMRRMVRDNNFRGWPPVSTLEQWGAVLEGERIYINPYRDDVDIKMDNTIDYEVCVWHELLNNALENREAYSAYPEIERIFSALLRFPKVDHKLIPKNSLLREFIGEDV